MILEPFEEVWQNVLPPPTTSSTVPSSTPFPTVYPHPSFETVTAGETGHRTLWVVTFIMGVSSLVFYTMAWRQPASKRLFHVLTAFITTFATLSYFAMASGQGIYHQREFIKEHHDIVPPTWKIKITEIYYARYVDWAVTTPLLLLDLSLLAGLNGASILVAIVADIIMVLTGLFAALGKQNDKSWIWYAFGCIAYLVVVYQLAFNGRNAVRGKDAKTVTFFTSIGGFTLLLWTAYPIIWGVADGSRILGIDGEIVAYAVLDVLAKPIFGVWLLFTHDALASSAFNVGGFWAHGLSSEGTLRIGDDDEGA